MTVRVLFLTQYYPPETGAPQVRISEMARSLADQGYEVEVLTALPSYPVGRVYDGYRRKPWVVEHRHGIRIVRTPIYPTRSISLVPRLLNYMSFVTSSLLVGAPQVRRPDVVICESPPLFLGISAIALAKAYRARLIFNVSDLWPDSVVQMGLGNQNWMVSLARKFELACYRASAAKTGQSPTIVRELRARDPRPVALIPNGCDCERFSPEAADHTLRSSYGLTDCFVVGYAGLLGAAQGVGVILDVAERTAGDDRLRYVIVGDGPERGVIEEEIARRRLANVHLAGHRPSENMPGIIASFDAAFIPLRYSIPGALPSKVYEAMASEVPVVLAADGDPRELLEKAGAGIVVDYERIETIVDAVQRLAGDPELSAQFGRNGRDYVVRYHQRKRIAARLGEVIDAVASDDDAALRVLEAAV